MKKKKNTIASIFLDITAVGIALVVFFPVYLMISTSFKTTMEYFQSPMGLPKKIFLDNYIQAWRISNFSMILRNSLFIAVISIVMVVVLSALAAYPLARHNRKLSKLVYILFVSGLMLPFQTGMIPLVGMLKKMDLLNTFRGIILVYVATNIAFAVFLFTGYIKSIPRELDESAYMDGCPKFLLFWKIIFPLMKPVTATVIIITALSIWNDFLINYLIIQSASMRTIPASAYVFFNKYNTNWGYGFAVLVLSMLPLVILFLALQKEFIKGVASGAVKG